MPNDAETSILVRVNGQEFRARDVQMLKEWCAEGRVRADSWVLMPGAGQWIPAAACDPLRAAFATERPEHRRGEWFVRIGNQQFIARDFLELKQWHRLGRVPRTAIVYHPSLGEWLFVPRVPGLENPSAYILHRLNVTYRGGIKGYPKEQAGSAFLTTDGFEFHGHPIHFDVPFERMISVSLDTFRPSVLRVLAVSSGSVPQVRNVVCLSYIDVDGANRVAEFQAHGAISLQGEGERAAELMNRLHDFKERFARPEGPPGAAHNATARLRELKDLLDSGVLTPDEFEAKKRDLLDRI
jgi:hypothetical protein